MEKKQKKNKIGITIPAEMKTSRNTGRNAPVLGWLELVADRCTLTHTKLKKRFKRLKMRIRWPGEPNPGVLIDVPVFSNNKNTEASRAIVARETNRVSYPVVANEKRFKAYLKATGTIRIDLLDGVTLSSVGHATISLSAVGTTLPGELARSIPILMGGRKPLRESATKRIGSLTFSMITTYETTKQQLRRKETPSQAVEDRRRRNKEMVRQRRMAVLRSEIYRKSMSPHHKLCAFIDANRDTETSLRTFRQALSNHGIHFAPGDAAELFAHIEGEDGTGIITWQQLRAYLIDTAPRPPTRSANDRRRDTQSSPENDTSTESSDGKLSMVDLNEECTHDSTCTCRRCVKSTKVVRRQLEEKLYTTLKQNEQPHTITPRPMPRPSHPHSSSSSYLSTASPETNSVESASPVVALADTVIASDEDFEEYSDEAIQKLLARGTKLQREMDKAQQQRRVVLSTQQDGDDDDDDDTSSSSSNDLITTLHMSTLPSNVLPLANLLEDISERLVHVYAVKITISHLLLIQDFSSKRHRIHVRYDLPTSEPSDTATIVMPPSRTSSDEEYEDEDEDTTTSRVSIDHQRVFPLLFTQEMAELWQERGKLRMFFVQNENEETLAVGHVDLNRVLLSQGMSLTCSVPVFRMTNEKEDTILCGSVNVSISCLRHPTKVFEAESRESSLATRAQDFRSSRFTRWRPGPDTQQFLNKSCELLVHIDGVSIDVQALRATMSTLRHGEKDILSSPPRLRVVYCSFVSKDQDNEKPVRYEMSSVTNQKNIRSEIVMNDLHLGDNPFLHNGGESDQDHTYFSVNSEMLESCDASEDLFQYMRHRSLVLEVWIDRERREDEEEDTTVLVGLAHVDLSELVSFSENRNVPSVVEWKRGSVEDPMTGAVVGTVRGIVALGYSNQLKMIRKTRDTTSRLKRCAQRWLSERRIVVTKRRASDGQDVKETQEESSKITDFQSARSPSSPEKDVSSSDFSSSSSSPSPVSNTNWMESLVDTVDQVLRDQETSGVITREHVVTVSIENSFQENDDDEEEEMWGTYVRYTYGGTRHILWWDRDKSLNTKSRHSASYSMTRNICVSPLTLQVPEVWPRNEVESDVVFEMIRTGDMKRDDAKSKVSGQAVLKRKSLETFVREAKERADFSKTFELPVQWFQDGVEKMLSLSMRFQVRTMSSEEKTQNEDTGPIETLRTLRVRVLGMMRWNEKFLTWCDRGVPSETFTRISVFDRHCRVEKEKMIPVRVTEKYLKEECALVHVCDTKTEQIIGTCRVVLATMLGPSRNVSGRFDVRVHPFHYKDRSEPPPVSCGNIELEMCFVEDLIEEESLIEEENSKVVVAVEDKTDEDSIALEDAVREATENEILKDMNKNLSDIARVAYDASAIAMDAAEDAIECVDSTKRLLNEKRRDVVKKMNLPVASDKEAEEEEEENEEEESKEGELLEFDLLEELLELHQDEELLEDDGNGMAYFGLRLDENDEIEFDSESISFDSKSMEKSRQNQQEQQHTMTSTSSTKDVIKALISETPSISEDTTTRTTSLTTTPTSPIPNRTFADLRLQLCELDTLIDRACGVETKSSLEYRHHYTMFPEETHITRHGSIVLSNFAIEPSHAIIKNNLGLTYLSDSHRTPPGLDVEHHIPGKIRITRHGNIVVSDFERFDPSRAADGEVVKMIPLSKHSSPQLRYEDHFVATEWSSTSFSSSSSSSSSSLSFNSMNDHDDVNTSPVVTRHGNIFVPDVIEATPTKSELRLLQQRIRSIIPQGIQQRRRRRLRQMDDETARIARILRGG